jgi:hypothetical protein
MDRAYPKYSSGPAASDRTLELINAFMRRVYNWMAGGLALSGIVAYLVMNSAAAISLFFTPEGPTMLFWGAIIGELVLVFALSAGITRFKVGTAATLFIAYSALNGITIGLVLLAYTGASVVKTFLITAGTFGVVSIWASTTKKDLSGWGSFLFMGLIGIIIASVVNMFFGSPMIEWIVSIVGIAIFVGLTAYDTQALRGMVLEAANEVTVSKMAIFGALKLYLDFINLFLLLLRFFGDRR